ncbi:hypothetical protein [Candidatus Oscillochloris fontis]|uniref:hypothetical protein n=1 Tax=Candidatus Oscillochloris fontis TaxID=2496868 RepID=UPI00101BCBC9|nr:hypothetical protein [Candidatus Oscillochloris fontis]
MHPAIDVATLRRFDAALPTATATAPSEPLLRDLWLIAIGNSGESVIQRIAALGRGDGLHLAACGINNDNLAPRSLQVRTPDGATEQVALTERLVFSSENPRDRIDDYPLLKDRYATLLRGIPVFETFPRAGYGGHGHPVISALDIDLNSSAVIAFLNHQIRRLRGNHAASDGRSDWERLLRQHHQHHANRQHRPRVVVVGGGSGSMGNAGHQLLPALVRHLLNEAGIKDYELWGVVLGPHIFSGLTPFTRHNYRALLHALDHLARNGQRRTYLHDLHIALQAPPYDRVFLMDAPTVSTEHGRSSDTDLERFFDQTALSLYLLLTRGTIWPTIASHLANEEISSDGRLRYLHTLRAAVASLDVSHLQSALADQIQIASLQALAACFETA